MNHRLRKLTGICRDKGPGAAARFLIKDVYFRVLAGLAFPGPRSGTIETVGAGRDPFTELLNEMNARQGARVLELGARAVSGVSVRERFAANVEYVGMDIHPGPNVDVVGDAHVLSGLFPNESFDGVFSLSVFEHLLMPWVVALEMNKVLKVGGLAMVATHPTWPPHELPWDFWRFQENAFWALFNRSTGFEIVTTISSTPARIFPMKREGHLLGTTKTIAPMGVAVLARKIGSFDARLSWPLSAVDVTNSAYPLPSYPRLPSD
jgi:hypothetical protein